MFRIDGARTIQGLHKLETDLLSNTRQALGQGAAFAMEHARATTKFHDRTTDLRKSITRGQRSAWVHFVRAGGKAAPHGYLVEVGTKAHVIEARRAKALRFVQGGEVRFAQRVHHPGTQPRRFMLEARDAAESVTVRFVTMGATRAIN